MVAFIFIWFMQRNGWKYMNNLISMLLKTKTELRCWRWFSFASFATVVSLSASTESHYLFIFQYLMKHKSTVNKLRAQIVNGCIYWRQSRHYWIYCLGMFVQVAIYIWFKKGLAVSSRNNNERNKISDRIELAVN